MDFPVTRALIAQLPTWVSALAETVAAPKQLPLPAGSFRWDPASPDPETLQVNKAVRMASGLRAAMILADLAHAVESAVLLRTVGDFAAEIRFVGEGLFEGRHTEEQKRFVAQHFAPFPADPDELAAREREYYVSRKEMSKAQDRMLKEAGAATETFAKHSAYVGKGYDSYVHGNSASAMELYSGRTMSYMMTGTESVRRICVARTAVAGLVKEALLALRFMAMTRRCDALAATLRDAYVRLDESAEDHGTLCKDL